jgi:hypothetical protein
VVVPDAPSPHEFNHVITAIELPTSFGAENLPSVVTAKTGKKYLLFDPTDPYTPVGQLHADLQGSYGLLSTAAGGELIQLPVFAPGFSELKRVAHFKLQPDGSLVGDVEEKHVPENMPGTVAIRCSAPRTFKEAKRSIASWEASLRDSR